MSIRVDEIVREKNEDDNGDGNAYVYDDGDAHLGGWRVRILQLVPGPLRKWAGEGLGQSIKDLALFDVEETTLDDEMPLLAQMTINDEENDMYFTRGLERLEGDARLQTPQTISLFLTKQLLYDTKSYPENKKPNGRV